MAKLKIRYLVADKVRDRTYYRWCPGPALRAQGFTSQALGQDMQAAIAEAERLNAALDQQRIHTPALFANGTPLTADKLTVIHAAPRQPRLSPNTRLAELVDIYRAHDDYLEKRPKTRLDYDAAIKNLLAWAGDVRLCQIQPADATQYYATMRRTSAAVAHRDMRVLRLILGFAGRNGGLTSNPAARMKLKGLPPRQTLWSQSQVDAMVAAADAQGAHGIADALVLGLGTGQRQADILVLTWESITPNGRYLEITQSKTGKTVRIPLLPEVAHRLASIRARQAQRGPVPESAPIVQTTYARAYSEYGFRCSFGRMLARVAVDHPDIAPLQYRDLRRTMIVRMAEAGVPLTGITAISGHSIEHAQRIIEVYCPRTTPMADAAIAQLITHRQGTKQ